MFLTLNFRNVVTARQMTVGRKTRYLHASLWHLTTKKVQEPLFYLGRTSKEFSVIRLTENWQKEHWKTTWTLNASISWEPRDIECLELKQEQALLVKFRYWPYLQKTLNTVWSYFIRSKNRNLVLSPGQWPLWNILICNVCLFFRGQVELVMQTKFP